MNTSTYTCCSAKKKKKKKISRRKLGLLMFSLGTITVLSLFLPLKYWVLILSFALIIFGILEIHAKS